MLSQPVFTRLGQLGGWEKSIHASRRQVSVGTEIESEKVNESHPNTSRINGRVSTRAASGRCGVHREFCCESHMSPGLKSVAENQNQSITCVGSIHLHYRSLTASHRCTYKTMNQIMLKRPVDIFCF